MVTTSATAAAGPEKKMEKMRIWGSCDLGSIAMDPNHTIQQLKERIHRKEGVPIERLRIHANGIEYPDHKTLRECGISGCTEVRAEFLIQRRPLKIAVVYGGERISVEVDEMEMISKLRNKLEEIDLQIPEQHFCFHDHREMRKDRTFNWHRVQQGDDITIRVLGGTHPDSR